MKRIVSLLLVLCFCAGLAACGKSDSASASPVVASAAAEAPSSPAAPASAEPTPAPTPTPIDLSALVNDLNAEELAQRTEDDPSIGVFEVGREANTINYKFAMHIFEYVIMMAEAGDTENLNAYNRLLESMPALEISLENALRETAPDLNIVVYLMVDEYSGDVAAVIENGEIIYDLVNGIGTAPTDIQPILEGEELPPEIQEQLDEFKNALAGNNG